MAVPRICFCLHGSAVLSLSWHLVIGWTMCPAWCLVVHGLLSWPKEVSDLASVVEGTLIDGLQKVESSADGGF